MNVAENLQPPLQQSAIRFQLQPVALAGAAASCSSWLPRASEPRPRVPPGARPSAASPWPANELHGARRPQAAVLTALLLQLPVQPLAPTFELPSVGWPPAAVLAAAAHAVAAAASQPTRWPPPESTAEPPAASRLRAAVPEAHQLPQPPAWPLLLASCRLPGGSAQPVEKDFLRCLTLTDSVWIGFAHNQTKIMHESPTGNRNK